MPLNYVLFLYKHTHAYTPTHPCSVYIITNCYVFALHNEIGYGGGIKNHVYVTVAWLMRRGLSVVILVPSSLLLLPAHNR